MILDERTTASLAATTRFSVIRQFQDIDSTNRYLVDEARGGAPEGMVAVTAHQTSGRGRLGRTWEAPPGSSLLASILLRPKALPADRRHLATAAVALAAVSACAEVAGFRPRLKWPNDLVVQDDKLAGILAEAVGDAIVVGLGMNLDWPPGQLPEGAVDVAGVTGRPVAPGALLAALLPHLERRCVELADPEGQAALGRDARQASATIGRDVRVELADRTVVGRAVDVSERGHLQVRAADGGVADVPVGDVVHLRAC